EDDAAAVSNERLLVRSQERENGGMLLLLFCLRLFLLLRQVVRLLVLVILFRRPAEVGVENAEDDGARRGGVDRGGQHLDVPAAGALQVFHRQREAVVSGVGCGEDIEGLLRDPAIVADPDERGYRVRGGDEDQGKHALHSAPRIRSRIERARNEQSSSASCELSDRPYHSRS